ncbi:GNAT family N-acetyltransferase [Spirillospora sp. NPDC029432]|uniref:GNAT family N-acetyltransferase n=1 Tax=Spirillospora sp. NPDC029432 TaxID=3154599 RepID=UPI0034566135
MTLSGRLGRHAAEPGGARASRGDPGWTVEVRRDGGALAALAGEWRDLYERSPAATPFQSHAWLSSWWRNYGTPDGLRLFLVRRRGVLVAAAPLMTVRRFGFPVLEPVAAPQSDFTDVLLDGEHARRAARCLARALLAAPGWGAIDLREVRPGAAAHLVAGCWPGTSWHTPASLCLELPAGGMDGLLDALPRRRAGKIRARLRRIDAAGIEAVPVPAERAAEAVNRLLDLHVRQWEGRPINPEHTRARFRRHLAAALGEMIRDGQAALLEYRDGDRPVAADLVLIGHDFAGAYLYGAVTDLRERIEVTLMLLRQDIDLARRAGVPVLSLLRGDEPYKRKWRPAPVRNERLILGRSPLASLYATAARARAELAAYRHGRTSPDDEEAPPALTAVPDETAHG